jgi:hypothetical protein
VEQTARRGDGDLVPIDIIKGEIEERISEFGRKIE